MYDKKYAVIDCENSGLFDFTKPADAEGQPRLASLGIVVLNEDLSIFSEAEFLICPEGWQMEPGATLVNGLTTEYLKGAGGPVEHALQFYSDLINQGYIVAAYNAQFDLKQMRAELRKKGMDDLFLKTPNVCLMRAATNVCKIPGKRGFKFPKLSEACEFFGLEPEPKPHNSLQGALRAVGVLRALAKLDAVPEAEVHKAKEKPVAIPPVPAAGAPAATEEAW